MILNTHPTNRKEMVKAISELTGHDAVYMFMPTYAYEIGPMTVNKDGTITCDDASLLEQIMPMLVERGWLDQPANVEAPVAEEMPDSRDLETLEEAQPESGCIERIELTMPLRNWMPEQLNNLIRILYSRQHMINRMMQTDTLVIDEACVTDLSENLPENYGDFEARLKAAIEEGTVHGISFADGKFSLHTPYSESEPTRWAAYSDLLGGILKSAQTAKRVHLAPQYDSENEKYHANIWLMRLGFAGDSHKGMRKILMGHLTGFAAFKNAESMQAHKDKYAQLRKACKEVAV